MSIVPVTQRDRGLGRFGPKGDAITKGLRAVLEERGYESEIADGDIWVRLLHVEVISQANTQGCSLFAAPQQLRPHFQFGGEDRRVADDNGRRMP